MALRTNIGALTETLMMQELRATIANHQLDFKLHYWRTRDGAEVDFVLYGEAGFVAIEVKGSERLRDEDFSALDTFGEDYPLAKRWMVYLGAREYERGGIVVHSLAALLPKLHQTLVGRSK